MCDDPLTIDKSGRKYKRSITTDVNKVEWFANIGKHKLQLSS